MSDEQNDAFGIGMLMDDQRVRIDFYEGIVRDIRKALGDDGLHAQLHELAGVVSRRCTPAPSGWQQRIAAIAKDAAERVAKNAGVAPQLCYAPILWALEDALPPASEASPTCSHCGDGGIIPTKDGPVCATYYHPIADAVHAEEGHRLAKERRFTQHDEPTPEQAEAETRVHQRLMCDLEDGTLARNWANASSKEND